MFTRGQDSSATGLRVWGALLAVIWALHPVLWLPACGSQSGSSAADADAATDGGAGDATGDAGDLGGGDLAEGDLAGGDADVAEDPAPDASPADGLPAGDAVADAPDAPSDGSGDAVGTVEIYGSVFNNTGTTAGRLLVGVFDADQPLGEPAASQVFDSPETPVQPYRLTGVPLGHYVLVGFLDVGEANTPASPGTGDLIGQAPDDFMVTEPGSELGPYNVEIQ